MSNLERLKEFYDIVWIKGDVHAIGDFFCDEMQAKGLFPGMALTPEDFQVCVQAMHMLVTDPEIDILRVIESGDWLSALVRVRCLSITTGTPAEFSCQLMLQYRNGKIIEAYNHMDTTSLMIQLGALPDDVIDRFLSGQLAA